MLEQIRARLAGQAVGHNYGLPVAGYELRITRHGFRVELTSGA